MTDTPTMQLILAAGTIKCDDLPERIKIAAAAGYSGLGLRPEDYSIARDKGHSDEDLRAMLDTHGLNVVEMQSVHGWAGPPEDRARGDVIEQGCYRLADAIGAQYMMVSNTTLEGDFDAAIERFAAICERAAEHGLKVALEYLPWGPVPDARTAWQVVNGSGQPNAGVLIDSWHHFRGANDPQQLIDLPADRVVALQIDDARTHVEGSLYDDTRNGRLNPGDGDFDLVGFVQLIDGMGVDLPYSVEVLSRHQRALPPQVAATESALATWRVLAAARGLDPAEYVRL